MKIILIVILAIIFIDISTAQAFDGDASDGIVSSMLGAVYENITRAVQGSIESIFTDVSKIALKFLSSFATMWLIIYTTRAIITGRSIISDVSIKMLLFIILSALMSFKVFDKYILKNLEQIFNYLPIIFNKDFNGKDNIISNILITANTLIAQIIGTWSELSWGAMIMDTALALTSIISILAFTLVVMFNVLIATVEFYMVMGLGSLLILAYFFQFTRSLALGGLKVVIGAIFSITLLSFFLRIYSDVLSNLLSYTADSFFTSSLNIILLNSASIYLMQALMRIGESITGTVMQNGSGLINKVNSGISSMMMKNKI